MWCSSRRARRAGAPISRSTSTRSRRELGTPSLVVCLDSGCGNYEQLWGTTSLRGVVGGVLTVEVLTEGVHSGAASGIVPSSFRILRQILDRIEDSRTGAILPRDFHVEIPPERLAEAREVAKVLGTEIYDRFPFPPGGQPVSTDPYELILNNTWRPALAITGAAGFRCRPTAATCCARRPRSRSRCACRRRAKPAARCGDSRRSSRPIRRTAPVSRSTPTATPGNGWNAPATDPKLLESIQRASATYFGKPAMFAGLGGSIPFMSMLGARFPQAQFMITGAMGPGSNAHGPNEFLHLPTGVRVTACVAQIVADHSARSQK